MSQSLIFRDLPATFPQEDQFWRYAAVSSILLHTLMLATAIILPMMFMSTIPKLQLLISVIPPPPAASTVKLAVVPEEPSVKAAVIPIQRRSDDSLVAPIAVPADIARVVDDPAPGIDAPSFGVRGGVPGGTLPDVLRNILPTARILESEAPPPPPPEPAVLQQPPQSPLIRLNEFYPLRKVQVVPPEYPRVAKLARIQGTVLLDVTLSEAGKVEEIRVVSGEPLLAKAAVDCVRNWIYEPPMLNGKAVRVVIPVRVNFKLEL